MPYTPSIMYNKYLYFIKLPLVLSDCLMLHVSFFAALHLSDNYPPGNNWKYAYCIVILNWVMTTNVFKVYHGNSTAHFKKLVLATAMATIVQVLLLIVYVNFIGEVRRGNFLMVFTGALTLLLGLTRYLFIKSAPYLKRLIGPKKTVSLFEYRTSDQLLTPYLNRYSTQHSFEPYIYHGPHVQDVDKQELHGYTQLFNEALVNGLTEVYISLQPSQFEAAPALQKEADRHGIRLKLIYNNSNFIQVPAVTNIGNIPVVSFRKEPLADLGNIMLKRAFDIVFSLAVMLFVLSWLLPIIALLIFWEDPGPIFFKQMRNGINGKKFSCFKFRSMYVNAHGDTRQASKTDERITRIGRFLRKTSMDELPQFWNVFTGSMSVVGPRPHMLKHTEEYRNLIDNYMVRHYLKPGITGWAQVNGFRGETGTLDLMEKRVEHDIWYIENWSMALDVFIILKTCVNVTLGEAQAH